MAQGLADSGVPEGARVLALAGLDDVGQAALRPTLHLDRERPRRPVPALLAAFERNLAILVALWAGEALEIPEVRAAAAVLRFLISLAKRADGVLVLRDHRAVALAVRASPGTIRAVVMPGSNKGRANPTCRLRFGDPHRSTHRPDSSRPNEER